MADKKEPKVDLNLQDQAIKKVLDYKPKRGRPEKLIEPIPGPFEAIIKALVRPIKRPNTPTKS